MHKKIEADLISLAHSVLQMKNKKDVFALKVKSQAIYEKLSLLAFIEEYVNSTPNLKKTKEELVAEFENALEIKNVIVEDNDAVTSADDRLEAKHIEKDNENPSVESKVGSNEEEKEVEVEHLVNQTFDELKELFKGDSNVKDDVRDVAGINIRTFGEDEEVESKMDIMANEVADAVINSLEKEKEENFIEQPFDELEKLFGNDESVKDDASNVSEVNVRTFREDEELESKMDIMANEVADTVINSLEKEKEEDFIEQPFDELEKLFGNDESVKDDVSDVAEINIRTLEEELKDTISVDVAADLFEKVTPKKSLNDRQFQKDIQIGLNDRIAFVKNLFDGSQEDFNRVISQLNTLKTETEAKEFINKMVKPDYNWSKNEDLEVRFMEILERRFA